MAGISGRAIQDDFAYHTVIISAKVFMAIQIGLLVSKSTLAIANEIISWAYDSGGHVIPSPRWATTLVEAILKCHYELGTKTDEDGRVLEAVVEVYINPRMESGLDQTHSDCETCVYDVDDSGMNRVCPHKAERFQCQHYLSAAD